MGSLTASSFSQKNLHEMKERQIFKIQFIFEIFVFVMTKYKKGLKFLIEYRKVKNQEYKIE